MPLSDSLIHNTHWPWPNHWEVGLAILQGAGRGFWVHTQDTAYRYKGLQIGKADEANSLGFDTETNGYVDTCLGMGGLTWRINVYEGDWQAPAKIYRDWLWKAYDLAPRAASRPQWVRDLRFTLGWGHDDPAILDALASKVKPSRTLIHFSQWRTNAYDENYPDYTPTAAAKAFFAKGRAMGFHIMPHCNAIDMDPIHPAYHWIRDFEYRDLVSQGRLGWGYDKKILSVPNSNVSLQENRARKVMVKVHPGLSMWRSILCEEMGKGIEGLNLDAVFIDVTLNCFNIHNCLVENTTPAEGMKILIDEVAMLGGGVAVGGEGLNEITAQGLSLAQAHLFRHMIDNEEIERAGGCAVNAFLFDGLCRTVGYASLSGKTEKDRRCSRIHLSLGAIPTVNGVKAEEIRNPNPYIQQLIDMANAD
jgi:hypothetical protein